MNSLKYAVALTGAFVDGKGNIKLTEFEWSLTCTLHSRDTTYQGHFKCAIQLNSQILRITFSTHSFVMTHSPSLCFIICVCVCVCA